MTSFIMTGNSPQQILNKTKTNTCRVISKHNSIPAAGKWSTHLYDFTRATFADGEYLKVPYCLKSEGWEDDPEDDTRTRVYCRWKVGDLIRIKEPFSLQHAGGNWLGVTFSDGAYKEVLSDHWHGEKYSKPTPMSPLFLSEEASRITVKVLEVKAFFVQDISIPLCIAEGCPVTINGKYDWPLHQGSGLRAVDTDAPERHNFRRLWDSKNGKRKGCEWASKPLVWSTRFELVAK